MEEPKPKNHTCKGSVAFKVTVLILSRSSAATQENTPRNRKDNTSGRLYLKPVCDYHVFYEYL